VGGKGGGGDQNQLRWRTDTSKEEGEKGEEGLEGRTGVWYEAEVGHQERPKNLMTLEHEPDTFGIPPICLDFEKEI
jgi:hypothetical protein